MKSILAAFVLLLGLAACGPIYQTEYTYIPPQGGRARACIAECDADRSACTYQCKRETQDCENEKQRIADREYRRYERSQREQDLPVQKSQYDFVPSYSCPWESECTEVCEAEYRSCFTGCGGRVDARQICVMGCSQAQ